MIYKEYMFKTKLPLIDKAMDTYARRQSVIAKNISNATTPGYTPQKVSFEEQFNEAGVQISGVRSDDMHISIGEQNIDEASSEVVDQSIVGPEVYFSGESHVNLDKEMSELAQNQIRFRFASKMASKYFQGLTSAIRGISTR